MTPQTIIQTARQIFNDNDADPVNYRQTDVELLKYVNDGLKECVNLSPDTFLTTGDYDCTAGQTEQRLTFADAKELSQVIRVKDGRAIHPTDIMALSEFNPDWASDTAAAPQNWSRFAGDPLRFYIYPKATAMLVLEVSYIKNPGTYALTDTIGDVPETWESALADYVVYRAESKDDEHSTSSRAVSHYQAFVQKITGVAPNAAA
jgi:hypothetical protein